MSCCRLCPHCVLCCAQPCLILYNFIAQQTLLSWNSPSKNTGAGYHFLLQRTFLTQGSNLHLLCLLHFRWILYPLSHLGSLYSAFTQEESQGFHFSGETGCEIVSFSFPNIDMNSDKPEQITLVKREQAKSRIWRWDLNICVNTQISFESIDHFDFRFSYQ